MRSTLAAEHEIGYFKRAKPTLSCLKTHIVAIGGTSKAAATAACASSSCRAIRVELAVLAAALPAHAPRHILIAFIDSAANDLPQSIRVDSHPVLLWFPARDKPYSDPALPEPAPYWDDGVGFEDMLGFFVQVGCCCVVLFAGSVSL